MQKYLARTKMSWLKADLAMFHNTSGGESETDAKLFMVTPTGFPSAAPVDTIATPVAKLLNAVLKSAASNACRADSMTWVITADRFCDCIEV